MAQAQTSPSPGMAIFSTHGGKIRQRQRTQGMSVVIRSDPNDDRDIFAAKLWDHYPRICENIHGVELKIEDYFDDYDQELQGRDFLLAVLLHIAQSNNSIRVKKHHDLASQWFDETQDVSEAQVQDLANRWLATNMEAFASLGPEHLVEHVFTPENIEGYEKGLLEGTLLYIQTLRNDPRMLESHRHTLREQRGSASPGQPRLRTRSFPYPSQAPHWQGPLRQFPPPVGRSQAPQNRYPQQRLTPSTELMEHIHPGSTNRGDFHSDPSLGIDNPAEMGYNWAVPSRGLPGPFTYTCMDRVPVSMRLRNYNSGILPRGKKNPSKKSSDDARKGGYGVDRRRPSSNFGSFGDHGLNPQWISPSISAEPLLLPGVQSTNMQITPGFPGSVDIHRSTRYVTNPFLGQPEGSMVQGSYPQMADDGQRSRHAKAPHSVPTTGQNMQTVGTQHFEYRRPDRQVGHQDVISASGVGDHQPSRWSGPGKSQIQPQQAPRDVGKGPHVRREHFIATQIWVGMMPRDFVKADIEEILRSYQGFVETTEPRLGGDQRHQYVFATFWGQVEAEQALKGLPYFKSNRLGQGNSLKTSWPHKHHSQNQNPHRTKETQAISRNSGRFGNLDEPNLDRTGEGAIDRQEGSANPKSAWDASTGRGSTVDRAEEASIDFPQLHLDHSPNEAVLRSNPSISTAMGSSASAAPCPPTQQTKVPASDAAQKNVEGQAKVDDKSNTTQCFTSDNDHSTMDGTNDPTFVAGSKLHMEDRINKSSTQQRGDGQKVATNVPHKNKSNKKQKSPNKPRQTKDTQRPEAVSLLENSKPAPKIEATTTSIAKDFLGEPAHPDAEKNATKARNVDVEATKSFPSSETQNSIATVPKSQDPAYSKVLATIPGNPSLAVNLESEGKVKVTMTESSRQAGSTNFAKESELSKTLHRDSLQSQSTEQPIRSNIHQPTSVTFAHRPSNTLCLDQLSSEEQDLVAQNMIREGSGSTAFESGMETSCYLSTAQTSHVQTQRSNSPAADGAPTSTTNRDKTPSNVQKQSAGVDPEQLRHRLQVDFKATVDAAPIFERSENPVRWEDSTTLSPEAVGIPQMPSSKRDPLQLQESTKPVEIVQNTKESTAPSTNPVTSQSRESENELTIPARSSSLPRSAPLSLESVPTGTHHKKAKKKKSKKAKKAVLREDPGSKSQFKNLVDVAEGQPIEKGTPSLDHQKSSSISDVTTHPGLEEKKPNKVSMLTTNGGLQAQSPAKPYNLPEPETPFIIDCDANAPVPKDHSQRIGQDNGSSAEHHTVAQQEKNVVNEELRRLQPEAAAEIKTAMEEAGYLTSSGPSSALHFTVEHPDLIHFNDIFELKDSEAHNDMHQFSDKATPFVNSQAKEQIHNCERAPLEDAVRGERLVEGPPPFTFTEDVKGKGKAVEETLPLIAEQEDGKCLIEGSSPRTPTKNSRGKGMAKLMDSPVNEVRLAITEISAEIMWRKANRGEREVTDSAGDQSLKRASVLLKTSPKPGSTGKKSEEWFREADQWVKKNTTPVVSQPPTPTRKSKAGDAYTSDSAQMLVLQKIAELSHQGPIVKTTPNFKTAYIPMSAGEDSAQVRGEHLADPKALFGTDKFKLLGVGEIPAGSAMSGEAEASSSTQTIQRSQGAETAPAGPNAQQVNNNLSSPVTVVGDPPKIDDATQTVQSEADYPALHRGRSSHVEGDETRAPSRGGYAAAARKSLDEKREPEDKDVSSAASALVDLSAGKNQGGKDKKEDPWAPDDIWGPGKGDGKNPAVGRGGPSKKGRR